MRPDGRAGAAGVVRTFESAAVDGPALFAAATRYWYEWLVVTAVSTNVTFPVLLRAGAVPMNTNVPPSTARSMVKNASFVALSRNVRLTCGPVWSVATAFVGASGSSRSDRRPAWRPCCRRR